MLKGVEKEWKEYGRFKKIRRRNKDCQGWPRKKACRADIKQTGVRAELVGSILNLDMSLGALASLLTCMTSSSITTLSRLTGQCLCMLIQV